MIILCSRYFDLKSSRLLVEHLKYLTSHYVVNRSLQLSPTETSITLAWRMNFILFRQLTSGYVFVDMYIQSKYRPHELLNAIDSAHCRDPIFVTLTYTKINKNFCIEHFTVHTFLLKLLNAIYIAQCKDLLFVTLSYTTEINKNYFWDHFCTASCLYAANNYFLTLIIRDLCWSFTTSPELQRDIESM